jgi:hypothetical protein
VRRSIIKICSVLLIALSLSLDADSGLATPITADLGDFSAGAQLITFDSIALTQPITNQFASQGVVFSGGLYGFTGADINFGAGAATVAANFVHTTILTPIFVDFLSPVTRVGFDSVTSTFDDLVIEAFTRTTSGLVSLGNLVYPTTLIPSLFTGIEDLAGIDRIVISTVGINPAFMFNDFRFESVPVAAVPEPAMPILLIAGFSALAGVRVRRRSRLQHQ